MSLRPVVLAAALALVGCGDNSPAPDAVAPRIVVVGPTTGTVLPVANATLAFRVEDAPALSYAVKVGTASTEIDEPVAIGAEIEHPLTLATGVNTVTLTVHGEAELSDEAELVLIHEIAAPPAILVEAPAPGLITQATTAHVTGRIAAAHPITTATATVGSTSTELTLAPTLGGYTFAADVPLVLGTNAIAFSVTDERQLSGTASVSVERTADEVGPTVAITFPRAGQAVRTRSVLVRGTVEDATTVTSVVISSAGATVTADLAVDGTFTAYVPLAFAASELAVTATDEFGNTTEIDHPVYFGTRLASGGAHGGAVWNNRIYTWGRNNLGQTGLDFISHESRTTYCDRAIVGVREIALCKATTVTLIDAVCLNPNFVSPTPADSPEAVACRAATRTARDAVCDAAGTAAPATCKTSASTNLATLCDTAYGVGTVPSNACKARLVCDGAYASGSPEHASCVAVAGAVPSVFPSPAAPYTPTLVATTGTTDFAALSFNQNASSALDVAGELWTWGDNASGQLCLGDLVDRRVPNQVAAFGAAGTTAVALSRGYDHLLVLRSDGSVWACGQNNVGQLGDGTSGTNRSAPVAVTGLPANIVQVLASSQSSYAVTATGEVYAWGRNQYGNLGNGTAGTSTTVAATPALVPGLANVVMIAGGRDHVLAVTRAGTIYGWGLNAQTQVNATAGNVLSPTLIDGVSDARAVYANGNQGFYEDPQGRLFGWGMNGSGNLGIPDDDDMSSPTSPVFGMTGVLDVGIGALQGFAMRGAQVFAWGWSFHGSLGAGASAIHTWPYRTPVLVQLPN